MIEIIIWLKLIQMIDVKICPCPGCFLIFMQKKIENFILFYFKF